MGAGFNYELQFLNVIPKYDTNYFDIQNQGGAYFLIGYEYKLNEKWKITTELDTSIYLISQGFLNVTFRIGASYSFFKKKQKGE